MVPKVTSLLLAAAAIALPLHAQDPLPTKPVTIRLDTGVLNVSSGSISLADPAFGGTLTPAHGGTGTTGLTGFLYGNGAGAATAGTSAQVQTLIGTNVYQPYSATIPSGYLGTSGTTALAGNTAFQTPLTFANGLVNTSGTVAPTYGTAANTFAQGNDTRFPATFTAPGIVYRTTTGSTDAVATTSQVASLLSNGTGTLTLTGYTTGLAPLVSPAFTGTPTVPTANAGDNSTKAASTQYADRAVSNAAGSYAPATGSTAYDPAGAATAAAAPKANSLAIGTTQTANATLVPDKLVPFDCTSGALVASMPASPTTGMRVALKKVDTSTNTLSITAPFDGSTTATTLPLRLQNQGKTFIYDGTSWWAVYGDLSLSTLDTRYASTTDSRLPTIMVDCSQPTNAAYCTTALQNAANAVPSTGGIVTYNQPLVFNGPITFPNPTALVGGGCGSAGNAANHNAVNPNYYTPGVGTLTTTAANGFIFNADGSAVYGVGLLSTATQTSGCGLLVNHGQCFQMDHSLVLGFYTDAHVVNGGTWNITNSYIFDPAAYGLWVENQAQTDGGDQCLSNCVISPGLTRTGSPIAGLYYQSGGGLKVINNKFNGNAALSAFTHSVWLNESYINTSDFLFQNNSLENFTGTAIEIGSAGSPGQFANINIIGGNISLGGGGIHANGSFGGHISDVVFGSLTGPPIFLEGGGSWDVGHNTITNCTGPLVHFGSAAIGAYTAPGILGQYLGIIVQNDNTNATNFDFTHRFSGAQFAASGTVSTVCCLAPQPYSSGLVNYVISGSVNGVGPYRFAGQFAFDESASGSATTATVVSTANSGSAAGASPILTLQLNVSAVTGEVQMQITNTGTSGQVGFQNYTEVHASGPLAAFRVGATSSYP